MTKRAYKKRKKIKIQFFFLIRYPSWLFSTCTGRILLIQTKSSAVCAGKSSRLPEGNSLSATGARRRAIEKKLLIVILSNLHPLIKRDCCTVGRSLIVVIIKSWLLSPCSTIQRSTKACQLT